MKTLTRWQILFWGFIIMALAACTAVSSPTPAEENSASLPKQTAVPALSPVTPTAVPQPTAVPPPTAVTENVLGSNTTSQDDSSSSHNEVKLGDALLLFERTGGMMGIGSNDQTWHFYGDGRVTVSDGRSWQVDSQQIATLVKDILALGFTDFADSYMPQDTCCDRFTYTLIIKEGDWVYQTTTMDGADGPPELFQAIDLINQFILTLPT